MTFATTPTVAILVAAALALPAADAVACQAPQPARDSMPSDSVPSDSARPRSVRDKGHPHAMQAALYAALFAPAAIAYIAEERRREPSRLGFWRDHASLYLAGGGGVANAANGDCLTRVAAAAAIEILMRGFLVEARVEHFAVPEYLRYRSLRVGRLRHPDPAMAAGITVGYRDVSGPRAHDGVEIGFPFVAGGRTRWLRMEAAYVMSFRQSSWNYRLQGERLLGDGPFFVGLGVDLKAWEIRRHGELSHATLMMSFGTTNRQR